MAGRAGFVFTRTTLSGPKPCYMSEYFAAPVGEMLAGYVDVQAYSYVRPNRSWAVEEVVKALAGYVHYASESTSWRGSDAQDFCLKLLADLVCQISIVDECATWKIDEQARLAKNSTKGTFAGVPVIPTWQTGR